MKAKSIFTVLLLTLITGVVIWNIFFDRTSESENVSKSLYQSRAIDHTYDSFVSYSAGKALKDMELPYHVNINGPYDKGKLNIYIIDFNLLDKKAKIGNLPGPDFTAFAQNNFIAFPPNLIIVDKYFLSYLILNCYNEVLSYTQAFGEAMTRQFESREQITEFMQTRSAITTYLSIGNYNLYEGKNKSDLSIDSLAGNVINNNFKSKEYYKQFYIYLLPVLVHELAHIKYHDEHAMGWVDIKKMIKSHLSNYAEEKRADDLSYKVIAKYLNENKDNPLQNQQLISFCRMMRNMVLTDTYRDFRGIAPEDLIVTLEQKQNLTAEELALPFDYVQRVSVGYENGPPPMTEEEFAKFLNTLNQNGSNQSHRHMFQRCDAILDIVRAQQKAPIHFLDAYLDLLSLNNSSKKSTEKLFLDDSLSTSGLKKERVLRYLSDELVEKKAINYEHNHVKILFFKNGAGYIELHGDDNNLSKVILVISTRGKTGELDGAAVKNLGFFARFIINLYDDEKTGEEKSLEAHAMIRNSEGSLPTFMLSSHNNIIKFTPMNESFYVRVEVADFHNF